MDYNIKGDTIEYEVPSTSQYIRGTHTVSIDELEEFKKLDFVPTQYARTFTIPVGDGVVPANLDELAIVFRQLQQTMSEDFRQYVNDRQDRFHIVESIKYKVTAFDFVDNEYSGIIVMSCASTLDEKTLKAMNREVDAQISDGLGSNEMLMNMRSDGTFYEVSYDRPSVYEYWED